MFDVIFRVPLTEWTCELDTEIFEEAGLKSNLSGSDSSYREHVWFVKTFQQAQHLRNKVKDIFLANVTIREHTTLCH